MEKTGKYIDQFLDCVFHIIVCAALLFFVFGLFTFPSERQADIYECHTLDIDWYQVLNNGKKTLVTVPGKCETVKGDTLTITGVLPMNLDIEAMPWLCFHSSLQDMQIYIDGELRGNYTTESTRLWGNNSVSAYYFIRLKPSDRGKDITFSSTTDSKYSGVLREIYYGTVFGMFMQFAKNNAFEVIGALLVLLLAIFTIIISEYLKIKMHKRIYLGYLGWTELLLSLWTISESPLRQLYFRNISLAGYMTHFAVYFMAVPVILFFDYVQQHRYTIVFRILLFAEIFYSVLAYVLEIVEKVPFSDLFSISILLHFIGVAYLAATVFIDVRKGYAKKYRLVCIGFSGFLVAAVLQLVMYRQNTIVFHGGFLCIGAIFWLTMSVISTLCDYFDLERENVENRIKAQKLTWQAMKTLVQTIEAKDTYTKGHSTRVARYSALLAEKMGLSKTQRDEIYYMGMLHDIGKIGIADTIINKPGKLTDEEYAVIKTHPEIGYRILQNMNEIKDIEYGARWHHERYDGKGYPDGLAGEQIPIYARIIAVADVYDAMTSNRSYRSTMPQDKVRAEIVRVSGSQLDPRVAACMIELIDEDTDYLLRQEAVDSLLNSSP